MVTKPGQIVFIDCLTLVRMHAPPHAPQSMNATPQTCNTHNTYNDINSIIQFFRQGCGIVWCCVGCCLCSLANWLAVPQPGQPGSKKWQTGGMETVWSPWAAR